ncbi:hypothetical protein P0D88_41485 [Paraburkholderia sp. RL18-103-BIB-C]|uniref:hypothetical protein n=1 Tax=unclassified Paraburkholderia TaxID=2615204 RepID=UPI0038BAA0FA
MAQTKPVTKTTREQETSNFPEQHAYQPIGEEPQNPEDWEGSSPDGAVKVKNRLPPGHEDFYIPEEQQAGNGNVSDQVKRKAKQAAGEVAKRKTQPVPKRAGLKGMVGYLSKVQVADLTAIAAAVDYGVTDYVSKLIAEHVAANPELVAKGREILATGQRPPQRSRRAVELEEENARLRAALQSVNPH